jgi:acyl-CoA synthetase (AMP-forming)/AMP-acid ligase II
VIVIDTGPAVAAANRKDDHYVVIIRDVDRLTRNLPDWSRSEKAAIEHRVILDPGGRILRRHGDATGQAGKRPAQRPGARGARPDRAAGNPPGCPGELYIGDEAVTRGYLNQSGRTAERYLPDPVSLIPGSRMYATGDRVRVLHDGNLVFLGRGDGQVKVRGYRVELSEVEAAINAHPAVGGAAVAVRAVGGTEQLVCYVVSDDPDIRDDPAAVLRPHLDTNFFDAGGHSLLLTEVCLRISDRLGQRLSPLAIFRHPTIAELTAHLSGAAGDADSAVHESASEGVSRRSRLSAVQRARRDDLRVARSVSTMGESLEH